MKSTRKMYLLTLIATMIIVAMLAGCSGNKGDNKEEPVKTPPAQTNDTDSGSQEAGDDGSGIWEVGSEPFEFSMYGNYDWYDVPVWGEHEYSAWIKENKQINIVSISAGGNTQQKLNTMIAGDELPDVIWGDRGGDVERLRKAGKLVPFDDYLDKYTNLRDWMGEADLNMLRSEDGKLYQFPNWYSSRPYGNAGYVVNKKIYEELGSPKLETTDDLYDYLVKVKETYGESVVPFEPHQARDGQGLDVLYSAFAEEALTDFIAIRAVPQGDKLTSLFTDPIFRESAKYIAKLYRERLMTQDAMTQTIDQITEKMLTGRVAVMASASPTTIGMEAHYALTATDPDAGYFMIQPIHKPGLDPSKIHPGSFVSLGWNVSVITTAAEDPEKIFAFLDWYTGPEGQSIQFWGPEGPDGYWNGFDSEGFPIFTDKYVTDGERMGKLQAEMDPYMWNGNTVYVDTAKAKFESTLPFAERNWSTHWQYEITWKTQANGTQYRVNINPAGDTEEGIINQAINDLLEETRAKILSAKSDEDVDTILDQTEQTAQSLGYAKLLEWKTAIWQENVRIMNQ